MAQVTTTNISNKIIYFKGLNAFRFIAAALVVIVHLDALTKNNHYNNIPILPNGRIGSLAVTFFFVLSGFLITYLLLEEQTITTSVAIRKFYIRRILRIWPLYYLITFIAFFLLNNQTLFGSTIAASEVAKHAPYNFLLYLFFLPNVAWWLSFSITYANQLWSVGVEEQFYLLWPIFIKYVNKQKYLQFMVLFVLAFLITRIGLQIATVHLHERHLGYFAALLDITRIDCMVIGGIGAYLLYYHRAIMLKLISFTVIDVLIASITVAMVATSTQIPYINHEVYSVFFLYIIISSSCNHNSILQIDGRGWKFLGNLSYGIYMWHMVIIAIITFIIQKAHLTNTWGGSAALYLLVLPATILVAWVSYEYIEKPFLKLKSKFALVKSSPV